MGADLNNVESEIINMFDSLKRQIAEKYFCQKTNVNRYIPSIPKTDCEHCMFSKNIKVFNDEIWCKFYQTFKKKTGYCDEGERK